MSRQKCIIEVGMEGEDNCIDKTFVWKRGDMMSDEWTGNNRVNITGEIVFGFSYSHEVHGERFYTADICTCRNSGYVDIIPVIVSERLIDSGHDYNEQVVSVSGQFRSYNPRGRGWRRLELFVFVQEIEILRDNGNENQVMLEGVLCKKPVYRKTPLGRELAEVLLAVNRLYGKADYIPCIVWGEDAKLATQLRVGTAINIQGRIQSREYVKLLSDEETEIRVAYEVSAGILSLREGTGEMDVKTENCVETF